MNNRLAAVAIAAALTLSDKSLTEFWVEDDYWMEEETEAMSAIRKLTDEQIQEAARRFEAGESTDEIASSLGVHVVTLRHWLKGKVTPRHINTPSFDLLMARTRISDTGCYEWQGARSSANYGIISIAGVMHRVHRLSYELFVGSVTPGQQIHHRCGNPCCWNVAHLEALPAREHLLVGDTIIRKNVEKTHCLRGHEFSPENTRIKADGRRECKECHHNDTRERRRRAQVTETAEQARERMTPAEREADEAYQAPLCGLCQEPLRAGEKIVCDFCHQDQCREYWS